MIDKLNIIQQRFNELSDLIIQPDIISDQKKYVKISREYKELKEIVDKKREYELLLSNVNEANEIIKEESDNEMIELANAELEVNKQKISVIEDKLKLMQMILKMLLWSLGQERVVMKLVFLQEIFLECIQNILKKRVGNLI